MVPGFHEQLISSGVKSGLKKYKERGDFIISWGFYCLNLCVKAQDYIWLSQILRKAHTQNIGNCSYSRDLKKKILENLEVSGITSPKW